MSSLNTFGSILSYAIEMESKLRDYYQRVGSPERAGEAEKRRTKLERVRRENVVEMTLEPIEGLDEADYQMNFADTSPTGQQSVERVAVRFYQDVAPKINVRQAQRALERCGDEHRELLKS